MPITPLNFAPSSSPTSLLTSCSTSPPNTRSAPQLHAPPPNVRSAPQLQTHMGQSGATHRAPSVSRKPSSTSLIQWHLKMVEASGHDFRSMSPVHRVRMRHELMRRASSAAAAQPKPNATRAAQAHKPNAAANRPSCASQRTSSAPSGGGSASQSGARKTRGARKALWNSDVPGFEGVLNARAAMR